MKSKRKSHEKSDNNTNRNCRVMDNFDTRKDEDSRKDLF